jgi:dolichol-phosphate mannosyltransferase
MYFWLQCDGFVFGDRTFYDTTGASGKWLFWLSPLADPLAFLRILISALNQPTQWRGRKYE